MRAIIAAVLYFALVFAAGFALGTVRTLLVAPRLGNEGAVLAELPLMLGVSWIACGFAIRRARLGPAMKDRVTMGALAFTLLILAETLTGTLFLDRTLAEQAATYRSFPALIGLAAQILFALCPLVRLRGGAS